MTMAFDQASDVPDEALLVLYANGDSAAARELASRHLPRVMGFAARMLGGDRAEAEDVAQEAMLRLWRIAPEWRQGEAKVSTWLYRVVTNLCTDRLRGQKRRRAVGLDDAPDVEDGARSVEASLVENDRINALHAALETLPDRQRQAVVLRHIEGLTNPEIAEVMEIGIEAVESLTARGKRSLTAAMAGRRAELGYEEGS
ncbi:RNA polymerase sigma factor [Pseudorhodobacter wandonensis]|uniref:RNA polymerase sigma factor n=1 Tax=Pseudorhodobacter wandonensis TaxID=1120568 RepID=UPI00067C70C5|nr:RNA polymerase sigma factor [Pseudorhodobacter wandonensis]